MRKASYAGKFYPADKKELKELINSFKKPEKKEKAVGIIVPHAGYLFSGNTASLVYSSIKQDFETVIVFGADHTGIGNCVSLEDFETPLGVIEDDKEISAEISKFVKTSNFEKEHSVEVQLPFVQTYFKNIKIVPMIISSGNYKELAEKIFSVIKKSRGKVLVVASSDLTHFGHYYGFTRGDDRDVKDIDKKVIDKILKLDIEGFIEEARKTTVCGTGAISVCMEICKLLKARKAKLLDYSTSADVSGNTDAVVGYAGIILT